MFSIPPPDNFWFFIIKFTISISAGVYLLNSYHRTRLLMVNALLFFFIAIRSCTEFYLPQVETFEVANNIAKFHAIILLFAGSSLWVSTYYYIRPFQKYSREVLINKIYGYGIILLPLLILSYWFLLRRIHYFNPSKLDGYWVFGVHGVIETELYSIYIFIVMWSITILIFIYAIYRDENNRFRNAFILIVYVTFGFLQKQEVLTDELTTWNVPNFAHLYLFHAVAMSWFVSGYRLFEDSTRTQTADLLNSISDIAISTDKQLNIIYINTVGKARFGAVTGQLVSYLSGRSNSLKTLVETQIDDLLINKKSIIIDLVDNENVKGTYEIKSAKLSKGVQDIGYTFLFTDLTLERKRANELEAMNKTKDQLFSIIAHDLRKPALAFQGIEKKIDYLINKGDFKQLRRLTSAIDASSLNLSSVLDNLLNWARDQRELPTHMHKSHAHLAPICNEVLALFQGMIDNKALRISNKIDEGLAYFVDINAFRTIIRNLTDNAIKFTPAGCEIIWSSTQDEQFIYLKIQDEGIGMSEEQIQQFYNSSVIEPTKGLTEMSGVGLGLQLVKDLVKAHDGQIRVDSVGHRGTTFILAFPLELG